jgi:predicted DNA-binding transcriptional regulator AlpA
MNRRRVLRTPAAADYVGLAVSTVEKMRLTGSGPRFVRLGERAVGYLEEDLDQWLEMRQCLSTSGPVAHSQRGGGARTFGALAETGQGVATGVDRVPDLGSARGHGRCFRSTGEAGSERFSSAKA